MLQTNKSPLLGGEIGVDGSSASEFYARLQTFLWRQWPLILTVTALTVALGVVYVLNTPSSYTAQATMIIDSHKINVFQQQSVIGDLPVDSAAVESQVEILRSENIALAVIKDLHLTEDAEFTGSSGGLLGNIFSLLGSWMAGNPPSSNFDLTRRAAQAFADRLTIKRVGLTYIIEISFRAHNPQRAAQIANAVADAYIVDQLDAKYQATQRASSGAVQDRIQRIASAIVDCGKRPWSISRPRNNIVDTGGRLMNEQQLSNFNSQLVIAQANTAEAQARLDRVQQIIKSEIPDCQRSTDTLQASSPLHPP